MRLEYDDRGLRPLPFGGERRMPAGKPVQVYAPKLTREEVDAYLLAIDPAEGRDG